MLKSKEGKKFKERRGAMKGKGLWTALLLPLVMIFIFTGCFGSGSSDEEAISAKERPVLATLKVTVDPQNHDLTFEPVTLGASSIVPGYSYPDQIDVQDDDTNATWDPGTNTLTIDITIINKLNATLEKVRTWTGNVAGAGAINDPQLGNADYPSPGAQLVEGWTAGLCYVNWGDWDQQPPTDMEGCDTDVSPGVIDHPDGQGKYYAQWISPVCGKVTSTWQFTGSQEKYRFYMQITGDVYDWNPDYRSGPGSSKFDTDWYTTYYALMASLAPDPDGGSTVEGVFCNSKKAPARAQYYWDGSLVPVTPGDTRTCGTLITDPHLSAGTLFALNLGLEVGDSIEDMQANFWSNYITNPDPSRTISDAFYLHKTSFALVYDPAVLHAYTENEFFCADGSAPPCPVGVTLFPGGFAYHFVSPVDGAGNDFGQNASLPSTPLSKITSPLVSVRPAVGYIAASLDLGVVPNFSFIKTTYYTYYGSPYGTPIVPDIRQNKNCAVPAGYPIFAGQWGFAHYDENCNFVVEGVDADLDWWFGMIVLKVNDTANVGDWTYINFDQTSNNELKWFYNNKTAQSTDDRTFDYCFNKQTKTIIDESICGDGGNPDILFYKADETGNPNRPPALRKQIPARPSQCPYGDGSYTCGGRQYVVGVVCVQ